VGGGRGCGGRGRGGRRRGGGGGGGGDEPPKKEDTGLMKKVLKSWEADDSGEGNSPMERAGER